MIGIDPKISSINDILEMFSEIIVEKYPDFKSCEITLYRNGAQNKIIVQHDSNYITTEEE